MIKTRTDTDGKFMIGGGISVAYDSVVGPVELILSTSNLNNNLTPYFSLDITSDRSDLNFHSSDIQQTC